LILVCLKDARKLAAAEASQGNVSQFVRDVLVLEQTIRISKQVAKDVSFESRVEALLRRAEDFQTHHKRYPKEKASNTEERQLARKLRQMVSDQRLDEGSQKLAREALGHGFLRRLHAVAEWVKLHGVLPNSSLVTKERWLKTNEKKIH
jgi:ribosomal protein S15P/S13E